MSQRAPKRRSRRGILGAVGTATLAALARPFSTAAADAPRLPPVKRWLAYYGKHGDTAALAAYDLVLLDPGFADPLPAVASRGAVVAAYLSLGEIRAAHPAFSALDPAAILDANPDWPGTRRIDLRHPAWGKLVLDRLIPEALAQGFVCLMLDTLDTPADLEDRQPQRFRGMRTAAVALVRAMRARHPGLPVIVNRGYDLLADLAPSIDAVIAESLLAAPDPNGPAPLSNGYRNVAAAEVVAQLEQLRPAKAARLPILSLDYWSPDDAATVARLYARERALGHIPYVATRLLDRIVPEPPGE